MLVISVAQWHLHVIPHLAISVVASPDIAVATSAEMSVYIAASYVFPIGLWVMGNVEILSLVNYLNNLQKKVCFATERESYT